MAQDDGGPDPGNFSAMTDFLPPAPNATAMVKYAQVALNKNTGAPNINIPLYVLKGRKLSTTIALGYSSTGIKVDEIASRVGMGWSLQAAGVITRTVRGLPDELNTRLVPPNGSVGEDTATYHFLSKISNSPPNSGGYDSQPDLFNFSCGKYSGSFVFNNNMQIALVNNTPLKIDFNFTHPGVFHIVDPEGISYYFGGSTATDMTKRDQTCGKLFATFVPTAWHLTRIEHPNGETIVFNYRSVEYTYDAGINETMYYTSQAHPSGGTLGSCASQNCSTPAGRVCVSIMHTQGYLLDNILVPGLCQAYFIYSDRPDCQGDKLLSDVHVSDLITNSSVSSWVFQYNEVLGQSSYLYQTTFGNNYTPYLSSLTEYSSDGSINEPYYLSYNDPGGRCPRLSFAQDHWGYFNGANNTTLIPTPTDATLHSQFPLATASREPNFNYAAKGMLSKIVYPTGRVDSLVYENNALSSPLTYATRHHLSGEITGTDLHTGVTLPVGFAVDASQNVNMVILCKAEDGSTVDPLHNKCQIEVLDPGGQRILFESLNAGDQESYPILLSPATGFYSAKLMANGSIMTCYMDMDFFPHHVGSGSYVDRVTAGLRLKEVFAGNPGQKPLINRYYYGDLNNLDVSSLTGFDVPIYNKEYADRYFCQSGPSGTAYNYLFCDHTAMYSSTLSSLYDFQNSPVSYVTVVESQGGDNFEKGGIQTSFLSGTDVPGQTLYGDFLFNAPKTNSSSYLNGKVKDEFVFMKPDGVNIVPLTRKTYSYKIDPRRTSIVSGYVANQKYFNNVTPDPNCQPAVGNACGYDISNYVAAFDITRFDMSSSWVYNDTVTEYVYNGSYNNPVTTTHRNYYDDPVNFQLSRLETYDSKANLLTSHYRYPQDYAGTAVYDAMVARNIVTRVVDVETDKGSSPLSETKVNFADWGSGNYEPASFQRSLLGKPFQNLGTINLLNAAGNVLEFKGTDGIPTSIIWGFNNSYPVTKIVGTGYSQAIAQLSVDTGQINTLSGATLLTQLNRVRQNFPSAQVTTYDYKPQTGVLSITDLNGRPSYYDYDSFRRLADIKDQDGNILKTINYHLAPPDLSVHFTVWANDVYNISLNPSSCLGVYTPVPATYTVPAGRYFSLISRDDANAKAQADAGRHAQDYVNQHGSCTLEATIF
jgi:hypothetical protein